MAAQQLHFEWDRSSSPKGEARGEGEAVCQVRAASERTEPIKGVTMEEVVRTENLKKALKRVCANKGGNAEPFLCRKRAPFPLRAIRVFSQEPMNRRVRLPAAGRDPYARWCGRAKVVRPSPIPIIDRAEAALFVPKLITSHALLPFKSPMVCATAYFGGIETHR